MRFGVHAVTILTDASAFIDGRCFDGSVSVGCVFSSLRTRAGEIEAIALAVREIIIYQKSVPSIEAGLTARIVVEGAMPGGLEDGAELLGEC